MYYSKQEPLKVGQKRHYGSEGHRVPRETALHGALREDRNLQAQPFPPLLPPRPQGPSCGQGCCSSSVWSYTAAPATHGSGALGKWLV